jgi:hypothetical protein
MFLVAIKCGFQKASVEQSINSIWIELIAVFAQLAAK